MHSSGYIYEGKLTKPKLVKKRIARGDVKCEYSFRHM